MLNSGVGYGTVSKGELFALLYAAPRLGFFPRHKDKVEQIARSARDQSLRRGYCAVQPPSME